jgi:hypothetical protein
MTLLKAVDMMPEPAQRPAMSTLASLAAAPRGADAARAGASPAYAFPLIEALDLPGGLPGSRALPMPRRAPAGSPAPAPMILPAADVTAPLPEIFRLLAAGPAAPDDAFAALRTPARAAVGS